MGDSAPWWPLHPAMQFVQSLSRFALPEPLFVHGFQSILVTEMHSVWQNDDVKFTILRITVKISVILNFAAWWAPNGSVRDTSSNVQYDVQECNANTVWLQIYPRYMLLAVYIDCVLQLHVKFRLSCSTAWPERV